MSEQLRHSQDLLGATQPQVLLPEELASSITADAVAAGVDELETLVQDNPKDSGVWAALACKHLDEGRIISAYACARTGYHRGLDALRSHGWRGTGPVPFNHVPNQGVLRAIGALVLAARAIGEDDEVIRCLNLLHDCDPQAAPAMQLLEQ